MARPLDETRRAALLDAATTVFAEQGLVAPTSLISRMAGASEGSFFTYFKTKDDLINDLYSEIRLDMATAMMRDLPREASVRARLDHVFSHWVAWGVANPVARRALKHLTMSSTIRSEVRAESGVLFAEVDRLQSDAIAQKRLHLPPAMASQALKALAEMTMDLIEREPTKSAAYTKAGSQMLWGALSSKPS
jgi:AcrR family transcriptional regulator